MRNVDSKETNALSNAEARALVERHKAGDDAAGWTLVLSLRGWLVSLCKGAVHSDHIEDCVADLGIIIHRSLRNYDPDRCSLSGFSHMIWSRRRERIIARYINQGSTNETLNLSGESEIVDEQADELRSEDIEWVLRDSTAIDEMQSQIFRLAARKVTRPQIVQIVEAEFPGCWERLRLTSNTAKLGFISNAIDHVAQVLGEALGLTCKTVTMDGQATAMCTFRDATEDQLARASTILASGKAIGTMVSELRRIGIRTSYDKVRQMIRNG